MRLYYAHPMSWYDTFAEIEDIELLREAGHEVFNPNNPGLSAKVDHLRSIGQGHMVMEPFMRALGDCDGIAYRPFMDGKIGAGVAKEVLEAYVLGMPVLRLPNVQGLSKVDPELFIMQDVLTVGETRTRVKQEVM